MAISILTLHKRQEQAGRCTHPFKAKCPSGCGGLLVLEGRPTPVGGLWPRALCSVCGLPRRTGRAGCMTCGAPLTDCDCEWKPDTGETLLKQRTSVLDMLLQSAGAGSSHDRGPPAGAAAVQPGGRSHSSPAPATRLKCRDTGQLFEFDARPAKQTLGWPRIRCKACRRQHRISGLDCADCGLAFLNCACHCAV